MNSKPVFALDAVYADLQAAIEHYATWRTDAQPHVLEKYDEVIRWIEWNPDQFPAKYGSIQRAILRKSYYVVYFTQEKEVTVVLAVLDGRNRPSKIRGLVSGRKSSRKRN